MTGFDTRMIMSQGTLYVISAPSGCGKTSLVRALIDRMPQLRASISHTTRAPRPAEVDAKDYHFVDQSTFDFLAQSNVFLEHAEVFGYSYGTSSEWVQNQLNAGVDVILEIDWQGAEQVCLRAKDAVSIFILPPSYDALLERLQARKQDSAMTIGHRMARAQNEMAHYAAYHYVVVNDNFDEAYADLHAIITSTRLRTGVQKERYHDLLVGLNLL